VTTVARQRSTVARAIGPGNYHRLARATGYTPQHVSRVLRGKVGASFVAANRIANAAGVTLDELYAYIERNAAAERERAT
jgi:transcriptional regulator with XRE-family HTH domain